MNNRRPSLIDQMAMAAALEGIGDDDGDDNDDSSDIGYDDDGPHLFDDDIEEGDEEGDEEEDDDDDELNDDDDGRIGGEVMAGRRAENELILDYDLPAEDDLRRRSDWQDASSVPSIYQTGR